MVYQLKNTIILYSIYCLFFIYPCDGLNYQIQDISIAYQNSYVNAINDNGVVVGKTKDKSEIHDFIWSPSLGFYQLPLITSTSLTDINNQNEIAGMGWFEQSHWFTPTEYVKHMYFFNDKKRIQELIFPKEWPSQKLEDWQAPKFHLWDDHKYSVLSVNDQGQVLIADHFNPAQAKCFAIWQPSSSTWEKDQFEILNENNLTQAYFINNKGLVLGKKWIKNEQGSQRYIVLYDSNDHSVTPLFSDKSYVLTGFNDEGQICGWRVSYQAHELEGFFWDKKSGFQNLNEFLPYALNNFGQMVGTLKTDNTDLSYYLTLFPHALDKIEALKTRQWTPSVWLNDRAIPLHQLVQLENLPWTAILNLNGINNKGQMIGHALLDGHIQGIILTPTP